MLWMVLNAMPSVVCLNRFVTERTSRPTYVNLANFGVFLARDRSGSYLRSVGGRGVVLVST
jgi:hypothetical protein